MATPATGRISTPLAAAVPAPISPGDYTFLQQYVYQQSGIVLDDNKHYLLESRLLPIVRQHKLTSIADLCDRLRSPQSPELKQQVIEAMTTNETLFFRDASPFDALRSEVLPRLIEQRSSMKTLRFWSAAASSGQEAYSLAMLLREIGLANWHIQILATDLSEQVLQRARAARYLQIEVNRGLPAPYLVKYFKHEGLEWQLKDEIRRMVQFQRFDLRDFPTGFGPFDVVFCRNVLIYFDLETKKKILRALRQTMHNDAHLVLGASETTLNLDDTFQRVPVGKAIFYKLK
jgi:chemotaxis protein methyltransferase CheR